MKQRQLTLMYTVFLRAAVKAYQKEHDAYYSRMHIHPATMDCWRVELLVTGQIMPLQKFNKFEGMEIVLDESVEIGSYEVE